MKPAGCAVLDTEPEPDFDALARLAGHICDTPMALISLVDECRQWFKAAVGMSVRETAREISFCTHALQQRDLLIVPDATLDPRFRHSPLVTGEHGVRFYAGAPLVSTDGAVLGTLCVMDRRPRTLTTAQAEALRVLARQVMVQFELRHRVNEQRRAAEARAQSEKAFSDMAIESMPGILLTHVMTPKALLLLIRSPTFHGNPDPRFLGPLAQSPRRLSGARFSSSA